MKATLRWLAIGSLVVTIGGCSGNTELAGSSGSIEAAPDASQQLSGKRTSDDAAQRQDARNVLAAALATAKENDRRVFVHVGAPW